MFKPIRLFAAAVVFAAGGTSFAQSAVTNHVLLISVDGMHAIDLVNYVNGHPYSNLAKLSGTGITYTQASCPRPSDSFPGVLALVTGGSPRSTGVWYDDSYDRSLRAPGSTNGPVGAEIVYDESLDFDLNRVDAGGGINPVNLPVNPTTKKPVYPHEFLKVNTIFEVIKAASARTAWCDKHPSYDLLNGPSGTGIDDLYTPEVNSTNQFGMVWTSSTLATQDNDELKVQAVLNEIAGKDHSGSNAEPVPAILGMNFQAVSVGQKLAIDVSRDGKETLGPGGYLDAAATPTAALAGSLDYVDGALGRMVAALKANGIFDKTYVIISAKHGQSPIDPNRWIAAGQPTNGSVSLGGILSSVGVTAAQVTTDDIGLIWLADQSQTDLAVSVLRTNRNTAYIQDILFGEQLKLRYQDPKFDNRTPDVIVVPRPGVIYTGSGSKHEEHGGFNEDDIHVALLVSNPSIQATVIPTPVQTTQVAPTILEILGLNPFALQAVVSEHTPVLPGFEPLAALSGSGELDVTSLVSHPVRVEVGTTSFGVAGAAVEHLYLQRTLDLTNWTTFGTNQINLGGAIRVSDTAATNSVRYYRTSKKP